MRRSMVGLILVVAATGALEPKRSPAADMLLREFSDWYFFHCRGQRALEAGQLKEAAERFREAIRIAWPYAASDPRPLARTYNDFALVLMLQGRANEAEPLAQWALNVREEQFGKQSRQAATTLHVLAQLASAELQYARAEMYLTRAVAIWERSFTPDHPQLVIGLNDLATLYSLDRRYSQAERIYRRVLELPQVSLPANHPYRVISLIGLASTYTARGEYDRAESTDFSLLRLMDRMPPMTYQEIAPSLDAYLTQLRKLGRTSEAEALESSARAARTGENTLIHPIPSEPHRRPPPRPRST